MRTDKRLQKSAERRTFRVRNAVRRAAKGRPRLSIYRSNNHMYAQIIDDLEGRTLVSASTVEKTLAGAGKQAGNVEAAQQVGKLIAERALEKGVKQVIFDRGSYRYHGRVKALATAAREGGLDF